MGLNPIDLGSLKKGKFRQRQIHKREDNVKTHREDHVRTVMGVMHLQAKKLLEVARS